jgi:hypothetical protein
MKLKAELLIEDCENAINKHTDELQSEEFRLSWFTIVCLLRAIGHVLEYIDKTKSPKHKEVIEEKWTEVCKTKPKFFWEFIKLERDRFIKEYEHGITRRVMFKCSNPREGTFFIGVDIANSVNTRYESYPGTCQTFISSGEFKGRNEKEVALEALNWWKEYIRDIKDKLDSSL